jgi:branched-subunit amino acid transport protein
MTALLSMLVLGAVSWLFRIAFITLLPADRLPPRLHNGLDYLAPAVLASIVAVELVDLIHDAPPADALALLAAAAVIAVIAHRTHNLTLACTLGIAAVLTLDYLPL